MGRAPNVWLDPATHQRARFDPHGCTLRFDCYADVATWIDLDATAIAVALIGTPASDLASGSESGSSATSPRVRSRRTPCSALIPTRRLGKLEWQEVGVGAGDEPGLPRTVLTALTSKGTIVGLVVSASVDRATGAAIRDRITALVKVEPIRRRRGACMMWKSTPVVRLDFEDKRVAERAPSDRFRLEAGAQLASYAH